MDDHNYITDNHFMFDLRDYTSVLEPLPGASADHFAVDGISDNPPVAELLEGISDITRRDILDGGAAGPPLEGAMPGESLRTGFRRRLFSNHRSLSLIHI